MCARISRTYADTLSMRVFADDAAPVPLCFSSHMSDYVSTLAFISSKEAPRADDDCLAFLDARESVHRTHRTVHRT